jgi:predicted GNAT family acetyltransferase
MATTRDGRQIELRRNEDRRELTAVVDGRVVVLTEYMQTPELVIFTHTDTDPSCKGQGIASVLARWALDDARARGYAVLPVCPFFADFIARHSDEYGDLVYRSRTDAVHD